MIFPGSSRSDPMSLPPTVPKVKFKIEFSCISLMIIKVVHPQSKNLKKAMSPIWLVSSTSPPLYPHPYSFFLGGERENLFHICSGDMETEEYCPRVRMASPQPQARLASQVRKANLQPSALSSRGRRPRRKSGYLGSHQSQWKT